MSARWYVLCRLFFCQAEDGIRDLVRSRGLGDVYKRQVRADARRSRGVDQEPRPPSRGEDRRPLRPGGGRPLSLIHI